MPSAMSRITCLKLSFKRSEIRILKLLVGAVTVSFASVWQGAYAQSCSAGEEDCNLCRDVIPFPRTPQNAEF